LVPNHRHLENVINESTWQLGDNCIVFENFMASIGDLMIAN
jgi:hypothetical protein